MSGPARANNNASAGRDGLRTRTGLPELRDSAQPKSAGSGAAGQPVQALRELPSFPGGIKSARRPGSAGSDTPRRPKHAQVAQEKSADTEPQLLSPSLAYSKSWLDAKVDQKSSFYSAVREYEKSLASLRKERDSLLKTVSSTRRQLEDANATARALEAERRELLAFRGRSETTATTSLRETLEKLTVAQSRVSSLEAQLHSEHTEWELERQGLMMRAEAAEKRTADVATKMGQQMTQQERAALLQSEISSSNQLRSIQAAHAKQLQTMQEQLSLTEQKLHEAQDAQRAASNQAHEWQELARSLERQLVDEARQSSESSDSLSAKLREANIQLKRSEAELIKVSACLLPVCTTETRLN